MYPDSRVGEEAIHTFPNLLEKERAHSGDASHTILIPIQRTTGFNARFVGKHSIGKILETQNLIAIKINMAIDVLERLGIQYKCVLAQT